jgi:hypothetical protein
MTVSTTANTVVYRGNGSTTQFAVPFLVLDEDHLVIKRRVYATGEVEATYVGTDYSYSGIGDPAGTLTLAGAALSSTYELVIVREVPYTQDLNIVNAGGFYPETVEEQLDLMEMQIQQIADVADRSVRGPAGLSQDDVAFVAGEYLAVGVGGQIVSSSGTGADAGLRTDLAAVDGAGLIGGLVRRLIHIEVFGTLLPEGTGDNAPLLQEAADYCIANGIEGFYIPPGSYDYYSGIRTVAPSITNHEGQPLVIAGGHATIEGAGPNLTFLNHKQPGGDDNADEWQTPTGVVWRGNGITVAGQASNPADPADLAGLTLRNLTLNGTNPWNGVLTPQGEGGAFWPAAVATGLGWDIWHKGIFVTAGYRGPMVLENVHITNFGGESYYDGVTNTLHQNTVSINHVQMSWNGGSFNPWPMHLQLDDLLIQDSFTGVEMWTGRTGYANKLRIERCGNAGWIAGGHMYPSENTTDRGHGRYVAGEAPIGRIDVALLDCDEPLNVGHFLSGSILAVDTQILAGSSTIHADGAVDLDLDITLVTDQTTRAYFGLLGGNGASGEKRTDGNNFRIRSIHTPEAVAAGTKPTMAVVFYGSLGPNNRIHYIGPQGTTSIGNTTTLDDYAPVFTGEIAFASTQTFAFQNVETTPAIALRGPLWTLTSTNRGTHTATLPTTNLVTGQEALVKNGNAISGGTIQILGGRAYSSGTGLEGLAALVLAPFEYARLRFSGGGWVIMSGPRREAVIASTATSVAPGATTLNNTRVITNAGAITYTVPDETAASSYWPIGCYERLIQGGAGAITVAATAPATINGLGGALATTGQYDMIIVRKVAANAWLVE